MKPGVLIVALLFAVPLPAAARTYVFTKIADADSIPGVAGFSHVAPLDAAGNVAFLGNPASGGATGGVYRGNGHEIVTIADQASFGPPGPHPTVFESLSVYAPSPGVVAFWAQPQNGVGGGPAGIYRGSGGPVQFLHAADTRFGINASATAAFKRSDGVHRRLFVGSAGVETPVFTDHEDDPHGAAADPSVNAAGAVAYHVHYLSSLSAVLLHQGNTRTTIAKSTHVITESFGSPAINDSGAVLFVGRAGAQDSLHLWRHGSTTTVASSADGFTWIGGTRQQSGSMNAPAINGRGEIAFVAVGPQGGGLYVGPAPFQKVIGPGDSLFGATVVDIVYFNHGQLNDAGQLSFHAGIRDSAGVVRPVIVRADPVIHDLAVTKVTAPAKVTLTARKPVVAKAVKVAIQNRGPHPALIPDDAALAGVLALTLESQGACPDLALLPRPGQTPIRLAPMAARTVHFEVAFDCANDPRASTRSTPHADYLVTARIDRAALDGLADDHPEDDVCPRSVTPPFEVDPHPDGTIKDRGCGMKKADKTLGDPIVVDVVVK